MVRFLKTTFATDETKTKLGPTPLIYSTFLLHNITHIHVTHVAHSILLILSHSNAEEQHTDEVSDDVRSQQKQAIRTFLHQKSHRVHQRILLRRVVHVLLTSLAMLGAWAIGEWVWLHVGGAICGTNYVESSFSSTCFNHALIIEALILS